MRTLDPNQRAAGRPGGRRVRRMLDDHWFRPTHRRGRGFAAFRWSGLAPDCSYRAADRARGITAAEAPGGDSGTVARLPDGCVGHCHARPSTRAMRPPIGRARLVTAPDDEVVIVPIKIVVEPGAQGKAQAKRDERGAIRALEIHHLRLIYGNIDELRIGREEFDASVVNNNII